MSFNSHKRNYSLLTQDRKSAPSAHYSLRKINHPPNYHWVLVSAKQQYYQQNNMKAAIMGFEEYLTHHPNSMEALYLCAIAYLHEEKAEAAIPKLI